MTVDEIIKVAKLDGWTVAWDHPNRLIRFPFCNYERIRAVQLQRPRSGRKWPEVQWLYEVPVNVKISKKRYHTEVRKHNEKFANRMEELKALAPVMEFCT